MEREWRQMVFNQGGAGRRLMSRRSLGCVTPVMALFPVQAPGPGFRKEERSLIVETSSSLLFMLV